MSPTTRIPATGPSRRQVLQIMGIGAAGTVVATGCGGDNGTGADPDGPREYAGAWPYETPPKGHFNIMTGVTDRIDLGVYFDLIFLPGGMYYWDDQTWEPLLAQDWGFDEAEITFTYRIKDGLTWSDGSPITSQDVLSTFWCRRVMRQTEWSYVNAIEATDDQTVVFTMNNPSSVVERYVVRAQIFPDAMYGEFAQRAQELFDAGEDLDSDEGNQLNQDLQVYRPENPGQEVLTSGPFRYDFDTITNAQIRLNSHDRGYAANVVKFDTIVLYNGPSGSDITPLVLSDNVDFATHSFGVAEEQQFLNQGVRVVRPPTYFGVAVLFNQDRFLEFQDVNVRRAFAHVIDRESNGTFALGDSGVGVELMAGFSDTLVPQWLSEDEISQLDRYELDHDRAAELLEEAGWTKQGDTWHKPDGSPARYEISYPSDYADVSSSGDNIASQLSEFGIEVTSRGVGDTQMPIDVDEGNFELAARYWGSSTHPHPHFAFVQDLFTHNIPLAANQGGRGMGFELEQDTEAFGRVDLEEVVNATGDGLDEEEQKEQVATAAIAFNELLPIVPIWERYGNNPAVEGVRVKEWPADDDPIMANALYADNFAALLILLGELEPVD